MTIPVLLKPPVGEDMSKDHYLCSPKSIASLWIIELFAITVLSFFIIRAHCGDKVGWLVSVFLFFFFFHPSRNFVYFHLVCCHKVIRSIPFPPHLFLQLGHFKCSVLRFCPLLVECRASSTWQPRICGRLWGLKCILRRKQSFFLWQWAWHSHACIWYHLAAFIPHGETLLNEHFLLLCK